jgi:hypothetical protein
MTVLILYVLPVVIAVVAYVLLTHLPPAWEEWLKGKKTLLTGSFGVVASVLCDVIAQLQGLDLNTVLPQNSAARVAFYMSLAMIVLRLVTKVG